jgi:hypothetical protein
MDRYRVFTFSLERSAAATIATTRCVLGFRTLAIIDPA